VFLPGHEVRIETDNCNFMPVRKVPQPGEEAYDIIDLKTYLSDFEIQILDFTITIDYLMIPVFRCIHSLSPGVTPYLRCP
jgi:hypothetical protein